MDKYKTDNSFCVACKNKVNLFISKEGYRIYYCQTCGLGFTKNMTNKLSFGMVKNGQTGSYHRDDVYIQEKEQFANIFQKRVNLVKKFFPQAGKILEIGSSTGQMLSIFQKEGWEVLGIEMSLQAAEYAKERGIPTLVQPFEKAKLAEGLFDVVIINHTLEHLTDPIFVLKKANNLLKNNGIIFIDVPNFGSLSSRFQKNRWSYLLPEEHLWHFTFISLAKMLEQSGFKVLYTSSTSGIWDYGNPIKELWQSFRGFKKRFVTNILTALPTMFVSYLKLGTGLTIIARKQTS